MLLWANCKVSTTISVSGISEKISQYNWGQKLSWKLPFHFLRQVIFLLSVWVGNRHRLVFWRLWLQTEETETSVVSSIYPVIMLDTLHAHSHTHAHTHSHAHAHAHAHTPPLLYPASATTPRSILFFFIEFVLSVSLMLEPLAGWSNQLSAPMQWP